MPFNLLYLLHAPSEHKKMSQDSHWYTIAIGEDDDIWAAAECDHNFHIQTNWRDLV